MPRGSFGVWRDTCSAHCKGPALIFCSLVYYLFLLGFFLKRLSRIDKRELRFTFCASKCWSHSAFIFLKLFYFWLRWVFITARKFSLAVACGPLIAAAPPAAEHQLERPQAPVALARGLSRPAACGIFPDQGSNPCPWLWQVGSSPLARWGSPGLLLLRGGITRPALGPASPQPCPQAAHLLDGDLDPKTRRYRDGGGGGGAEHPGALVSVVRAGVLSKHVSFW